MRSYMDLLRRRGPSLSLAAGFWLPELTRGYPRLAEGFVETSLGVVDVHREALVLA